MAKRPAAAAGGNARAWYETLYSGAMSDEYKAYMANEWGFEKRGDQPLFEKLSLEGAQAGLSWATILSKREGYRSAFHGFEIGKVAAMTTKDVDHLLSSDSATIIRHRGKIESVINNAKCIQALIAKAEADGVPTPTHGHFDALIWKFVDSQPQLNHWESPAQIPSESPQATAMSHELKQLGFKFVGPKCCYSLMQSCGLVIDHPKGTPEWEAAFQRLAGRASSANSAGTHAKQGKRGSAMSSSASAKKRRS